jgi:four helix bundle protein
MSTNQSHSQATRIQSHRDLIVWQKARKLHAMCFVLARTLPDDERFEMQAQIRSAAASVATNIAEGHARLGKGDYTRHLSIARGSLAEVECLLDLGTDVGYFTADAVKPPLVIADEVGRMLWSLVKKLGSRQILPSRNGER